MKRLACLCAFFLLLSAVQSEATPVLREIPFVRKTTLAVPATYTFRFSLWTAEDPEDLSGTMVWSEEAVYRLTTKKVRHSLGSVEPLDPSLFSEQLWVQVDRWKNKAGSWAPAAKGRTMLTLVPYAMRSLTVAPDGFSHELLEAAADCSEGEFLVRTASGWSCQAPAGCTNGDLLDCYAGPADTLGVGECREGRRLCSDGSWGACMDPVYPGTETCDGRDEDCNGVCDDGLTPLPCPMQSGVCVGSVRTCGGVSGWLECAEDEYGASYEPTEATCDGLDNDCDSLVDEDLAAPPCALTQGVCSGSVKTCGGLSGWLDCTADDYGASYEPVEQSCDGLDNDCDAMYDEELVGDPCPLQDGVCAGSTESCEGAAGWVGCTAASYGPFYEPWTESACVDGLDNDCDGSVDENAHQAEMKTYGNEDFTNLTQTSYPDTVDGSWTYNFDSVLVSGHVLVETTGTYEIRLEFRPRGELTFDGSLVGEPLGSMGICVAGLDGAVTSAPLELAAGVAYPFQVRFRSGCNLYSQSLRLLWKESGAPSFTVIPAGNLYRPPCP